MPKKLIFLLAIINLLFISKVFSQTGNKQTRVLVVYFSYTGNTRFVAKQLTELTNAELFEIIPVKKYPDSYSECVDQAKIEISKGYKPPLVSKINNMDSFNVIFVGSPNWWGTIAPPVATFLSSYNLKGKKIIPFITHRGSALGSSVSDIRMLCPESEILEGIAIRSNQVKFSKNELNEWLVEIGILK